MTTSGYGGALVHFDGTNCAHTHTHTYKSRVVKEKYFISMCVCVFLFSVRMRQRLHLTLLLELLQWFSNKNTKWEMRWGKIKPHTQTKIRETFIPMYIKSSPSSERIAELNSQTGCSQLDFPFNFYFVHFWHEHWGLCPRAHISVCAWPHWCIFDTRRSNDSIWLRRGFLLFSPQLVFFFFSLLSFPFILHSIVS